jgi:hypothetical protein
MRRRRSQFDLWHCLVDLIALFYLSFCFLALIPSGPELKNEAASAPPDCGYIVLFWILWLGAVLFLMRDLKKELSLYQSS